MEQVSVLQGALGSAGENVGIEDNIHLVQSLAMSWLPQFGSHPLCDAQASSGLEIAPLHASPVWRGSAHIGRWDLETASVQAALIPPRCQQPLPYGASQSYLDAWRQA